MGRRSNRVRTLLHRLAAVVGCSFSQSLVDVASCLRVLRLQLQPKATKPIHVFYASLTASGEWDALQQRRCNR
ncbi:hypothetical protein C8Q80DRAFT_1158132 [Daedaleopsis nitida]|nr:hypothetical protein C8Q80DRAFT_1158132 [Daedaleopsis nitida]